MTDFDGLPAWARRRLARRFERGGNARILRWMSVPVGRGLDANAVGEDASAGNLVVFTPRPDAVPNDERLRIRLAG